MSSEERPVAQQLNLLVPGPGSHRRPDALSRRVDKTTNGHPDIAPEAGDPSAPSEPPDAPDPPAKFPAVIPSGAAVVSADAELRLVPALIAAAGDAAGWRYVEFFTANIRNPNTRRAYARACARFFAWCEAWRWRQSDPMMSPPISRSVRRPTRRPT